MEKEMFPIIKAYLVKHGYDVKAEVMHADIVAKKDQDVIIIEMKTSFTISLIYQGLKREHLSDNVYLAIPRPSSKVLKSDNFHEKKSITRRLELGLILVDMTHETLDVLFDPAPYHFKKQHQKKERLLKEFNMRKTSLNTGGVTKTKIITAYKELTLLIAEELKDGPRTTAYLKEALKENKVTSVLQKNYEGWFERIRRGVYHLTDKGEQALKDYQTVIAEMKEKTI